MTMHVLPPGVQAQVPATLGSAFAGYGPLMCKIEPVEGDSVPDDLPDDVMPPQCSTQGTHCCCGRGACSHAMEDG